MLQKLCISNVALIEKLDMEFGEGLNILTGETGAGKSIVIDAVNLVLGERASRELIKHDAQKAKVEAWFIGAPSEKLKAVLEENGIDEDDDTLILTREISAAGKSMCRINGTLVTLAVLKSVSDLLVDIHGQHEHQTLLDPAAHLAFLDICAPEEKLRPAREKTAKAAEEYHKLLAKSRTGMMSEAEREHETGLLQYQINEIESAKLEKDEEDALLKERSLLANAERIMTALEESYALMYEERGALQQVQSAKRSMEDISAFDEAYSTLCARIDDLYYNLEDVAYTLRDCKNDFEYDGERLAQIEKRLDLIALLKRKYGGSTAEILAYCERSKARLQEILDAAADQEAMQARIEKARENYFKAASELTAIRKKAAEALREKMLSQLRDVGMGKADFSTVFIEPTTPLYSSEGEEQVEFLLSANPGEPLKALAKVASGGELSRIMLAFKTILADRDEMPTLIFDEIDTGISGKMASVVGGKMVSIAGKHQILCVTHLPQIAAMADVHYLVEKSDDGKSTQTKVMRLDAEGCVKRLSAMMSGEADSKLGQEHARELLVSCEKEKALIRAK